MLGTSEFCFNSLFFKDAVVSQRITGFILLNKILCQSGHVPALAKESSYLQILTDSSEIFSFILVISLNFYFLKMILPLRKEESWLVLAMIFFVMRKLRCLFRLELLRLLVAQSSLSCSLKPSYVVFRDYKIYYVSVHTVPQAPSLAGVRVWVPESWPALKKEVRFFLRGSDADSQQPCKHRLYGIAQACLERGKEGSPGRQQREGSQNVLPAKL